MPSNLEVGYWEGSRKIVVWLLFDKGGGGAGMYQMDSGTV